MRFMHWVTRRTSTRNKLNVWNVSPSSLNFQMVKLVAELKVKNKQRM